MLYPLSYEGSASTLLGWFCSEGRSQRRRRSVIAAVRRHPCLDVDRLIKCSVRGWLQCAVVAVDAESNEVDVATWKGRD